MTELDADMVRVVTEQRLGFVATVNPDGSPNLSPKGTTAVWGPSQLVFLHLFSHQTVENLRANPAIEINVVDPIVRKGYRFKGTATVLEAGDRYDEILDRYVRRHGTDISRVRAAVLVDVTDAAPVISPAYDSGQSEAEISDRWRAHHLGLHPPEPGS